MTKPAVAGTDPARTGREEDAEAQAVSPGAATAVDPVNAVISHRGGPLVVIGGAGSGKTFALRERFLRLVARGERPHRLAFVVPTRGRAQAVVPALEARLTQAYEQLFVVTPEGLAAAVLGLGDHEARSSVQGPGDRVAMLLERIDELSLRHHDFAGSATALVGGFVRRIDRLKAEMVTVEEYERWAERLDDPAERAAEREFAGVYAAHERMLAATGGGDTVDLTRRALRRLRERGAPARAFAEVIVDDGQELDLVSVTLIRELAGTRLTVAGDPVQAVRRFRGAGAARMRGLASGAATVIRLAESRRCPPRLLQAAWRLAPGESALAPTAAARTAPASTGPAPASTDPAPNSTDPAPTAVAPAAPVPAEPDLARSVTQGELEFWRCANDRAQAQSVAADIERLVGREGVAPGAIAVLVPSMIREGAALAVALSERAVPHRLVGEAAFFHRAEIRDLLAWLRALADPTDAAAVVRALARPPVELRSVDIARCTQIARRRKLDMVSALGAALESPQVPPEARERIRAFLKLYRQAAGAFDSSRPDLYTHRLIDRLGLRRRQLYAAQADVAERLRALARFGELAAAHVRRSPQATPREFARSIAAVADAGLHELEEPVLAGASAVQVLPLESAGGLELEHVYLLGLHAGLGGLAPQAVPNALLHEALPLDTEENRLLTLRQALHVGVTRASRRAVLSYACTGDQGAVSPSPLLEDLEPAWVDHAEELFGPAEALHSTYRLLRDELLEGTLRVGGRLGELRFDTALDISHAVTRYLELLKVAALIARPEGQPLDEALGDVNDRILQAVTSEQREIFRTSQLDDYLLEGEAGMRRRAQALAARDEPSLEAFIPRRGEGVVMSASDIDTYRTCPLKYKFARVFRIPQEPTLHQRFGIVVHQVLERFHGVGESGGGLPELLGLLEQGWRRSGFGDTEEERQLRGKAASALARYHSRFVTEGAQPVWFERQFTFHVGRHLLRGRVDRVDRLADGEFELIDYKTGRPRTPAQLAEDVQLSLYAVGAREAWELESSRQTYYYLLDDQKVTLPPDASRGDWIREVVTEVGEGIQGQGFEPTPSFTACSLCDYRLICPAAER